MKRKILIFTLLFLLSAYFTINAYGYTTDMEFKLDKNEYTGLGDMITITVKAPHLDIRDNAAEHLELQVYTSEDPKGFYTYIQETENKSGIFKGILRFSLTESNPKLRILKVSSGIKIYIKYNNYIEETTWHPEDAEVRLDKKSYGGYGDRPVVTLADNDMNMNILEKEEVNVTVASSSDTKGIVLKLVEKSADSGIFTGDFGFDEHMSDNINKKLRISYDDTVTVSYTDDISTSGKPERRTCSSVWRPVSGTVKLNKSSYVGVNSTATVTVTDKDLNLRLDYKDIARVRITSEADPKGFVVIATETGVNTGTFTGTFEFNSKSTDNDKKSILVNSSDKITASYTDEINADNKVNESTAAVAGFQFSQAKIQTSAANDEGSGNMIEITISEADANSPNVRDNIIAKAGTGDRTDDVTIRLEETGTNTGVFKSRLYLTGDDTGGRALQVSPSDKINIKYIDDTVPKDGKNEIIKTVKWQYQSVLLKLDKAEYIGYNSPAKITLVNMDLNKHREKADYVEVKVDASSSNGISLKLAETGADSGEFTGTLYFGKSSNRAKQTIKVSAGSTVVVSYINKSDRADSAECSASWSPQDGQITLDRQEYKGNGIPVRITVKDWDAAKNTDVRDELKVVARIQGSAKSVAVMLSETNKNSGTFTGTVYINGRAELKPSLALKPADRLEVTYTDEDTTTGAPESRSAYATWGGISEASLTLDKTEYQGYDTYMTITLNDPDQNKNTTSRDKVVVRVKSENGKTNLEYTLTETGVNTGIYTAKLKLSDDNPSISNVRVTSDDEITVTFKEKEVEVSAIFGE